ncbi:MAG: phosphatase PAP2 family protein [Anaerolineae bacterium]|nr:phosphatase PAP2 family protein [Anaerolineae bacterium]
MESSILDWGINVILWFQQFSPTLDLPFKVLTFMGEEEFFLLLLPLVYWCLDRRFGARLAILFLFSAYLNAAAKVLAGQPRPFAYDVRVRQLAEAVGGGLPSGHTQNAVAVWGYLAATFQRTWLWVVAGLLMVLIPLSRIYLGVHFPTDLLGGYLIGVTLLLLYLWLEPATEAWFRKKSLAWQLGVALAAPLLLMLLLLTEDSVTTGAVLMGMGIGFVLERHWVGFESGGVWWKQVLRLLLGVAVLFGLWMGLRLAFASAEPALLFRFVRYGLVGLWSGLGAPWAFVRLQLAETR